MKARYAVPSLLLTSLLALGSPGANASDDLAGALIGAGAGAILGHAVNGGDGAIVGGFLGAILGAAVADDDDHRDHRARARPVPVYAPPVVRYDAPPRPWVGPVPVYPDWRHDRYDRYNAPGLKDRDGWQDDRDDRRDHDWNRRPDERGSRADMPRNYRNW